MSEPFKEAKAAKSIKPKAETVEAIKTSRSGEVVEIGSLEELIADLHSDD